jgi:phytoene dehydrogenase-like protein
VVEVERFDAIIIGAGYGGLICGAILAKHGLKILILDHIDTIGGKGSSAQYKDILTPYGHRDGRDTGDLVHLMSRGLRYGIKAAKAAGADIKLVGPFHPVMRGHLLPEGIVANISLEASDFPRFVEKILGVPPELLPKFREIWGDLAEAEPKEFMSQTFKEWLPTLEDEPIREAFNRIATILYSLPAGDTCVGRFIEFVRNPWELYYANDPEVGGMQGFMEPYARVIRSYGSEIRLGVKPLEIIVEDYAVKGVVVQEKSSFTQELYAPRLIYNHLVFYLFDIIDEDYFPKGFVNDALKLKEYNGDIAVYNAVLSRLPTRRADKKTEDYIGWNRILRGPQRTYGGGWWFPSMASERVAPPGKHLLEVGYGTSGIRAKGHEPFKSFEEAKEKLDIVLTYIREFYLDLDQIIEWSAYFLNKAPTINNWMWTGLKRVPLKAPTIKGLYFVGTSVEALGAIQDIDANAAMQVADLIIKEQEKL